MTTRIHRSAEQWQAIVDRQARSDLSAKAFCDSEQLCYAVFCKWRKRLSIPDQSPLVDLSALVDGRRVSQWDIELDLGDGMTLRLRRG